MAVMSLMDRQRGTLLGLAVGDALGTPREGMGRARRVNGVSFSLRTTWPSNGVGSVIGSAKFITGSFNFTKAAEENNAENLLAIRSPDLATKYAAN